MRQPRSSSDRTAGSARGGRRETADRRTGPAGRDGKAARAPEDDAAGKGDAPAGKTRRRRRRFRLSPLVLANILFGLLLLGYGGAWVVTARGMQSGLEAWVAQQRAAGVDVTYGPAEIGGFPLKVTATVEDMRAQATPENGGWTWSTPRIRFEVAPWNPSKLTVHLHAAPHQVTVPTRGRTLRFSGLAGEATLTMALRFDGPPDGVGLTVRDAVVESPAWPEGPVTLAALDVAYTANQQKGFFDDAVPEEVSQSLTGRLEGLHLPAGPEGPFAATVQTAGLDADVMGPLDLTEPLETALRSWKAEDGRLRVNSLFVEWAPLTMDAGGSLALDMALQPEGTLRTRVSGFLQTIDGLAREGVMRGRDATMAKVVLGTMSRPGPEGEPVLEIPVVLRDGMLWAGPIALMPLPRMPWGPPPGSLGDAGVRPGFTIDRDGAVIPNE
ncbi:DUF2125 domain-containing protein [Roseospira navarrensis]|nr:DUF2125 domain-containing protein [Roseospira navarrensis]